MKSDVTVNKEIRRRKRGKSQVIVAKKITNEKDRREQVSYLDVLTKLKEMQICDGTQMISYHTAGEQRGNSV